ncbi:YcaO-like family protein [Sorangium sp. So ce861]|uniref:YcaO-like family protein n=1 Tax=Sorangium sp. So ce861 TaxID=3133323 RepID=UPI003F5E3FA7
MTQPLLKAFREGTHRLVPPAQTLTRLAPHLAAFGITRVADVTGLDVIGLPVVMVCRPNSASLAVSQGKGLTADAARASGLMESIESFHAETIDLPLKLASHRELSRAYRVVDVTALPRFSVSAFHEHHRLLWVEGHDLLHDEPVWVPYEMVHTNYTLPLPAGSGSFVMSSNGLASGNHLLEAISHGICEVVERDATTLWRAGGGAEVPGSRVDLDTVDDPACRRVLALYEAASVAVGVWDTTTELGLPSFLCLIVDSEPDPFRLLYATEGMGCHPDRGVALLRALTEAAQSRLTFIAGSRDDGGRDRFERVRHPDYVQQGRAQIADLGGPLRDFRDIPSCGGDTLDEDVARALDGLRSAGIDRVIVVDLSKTGLGVAVVRVIIPGLESVDDVPGFVPGPRARARMAARGAGRP